MSNLRYACTLVGWSQPAVAKNPLGWYFTMSVQCWRCWLWLCGCVNRMYLPQCHRLHLTRGFILWDLGLGKCWIMGKMRDKILSGAEKITASWEVRKCLIPHLIITRSPFYKHGFTLIPAWISYHFTSPGECGMRLLIHSQTSTVVFSFHTL